MRPDPQRHRWTLLFDADDTLWENSVFLERAIARFIRHLDHGRHTPDQIRAQLDRCELETIAAFGYGSRSFQRSLTTCLELLTGTPATLEDHQAIADFSGAIAEHDILLLQHVETTLAQLARRHTLLLVSKGDPNEQHSKLQRSGLAPLFTSVEVVREKNTQTYRHLIATHALDPQYSCMVGNSPRSDINPALSAGLHVALIAHPHTWVLEDEELRSPQPGHMLLELNSIEDLLQHF